MGYYEKKEQDLKDLISKFENSKSSFDKAFDNLKKENLRLEEKEARLIDLKDSIKKITRERQIGFPWLAKAYEEFFNLQDRNIVDFLKYKSHPAISASDIVKEQSKRRRLAEKDKKVAEYLVNYYEHIAPFLIDLKEELELDESESDFLKDYSEEEKHDEVTKYLTKEEYRKLSSIERNQMALDRFWKRPKSKWLIGRLYERYVGYLYEEKGYEVDYFGIIKGFEDLGRDLICRKDNEIIIIQCKNWSQFRTIYEKHIFQFFGTVFQYRDENPLKKVRAIFYTSTNLSDLARRFSKELGIELKENIKMDIEYPCIKCNISKVNGEKIYHLPFDQQYDKTKIEKNNGEFFCKTVKEAEEAGFRRAFRYHMDKK